MKVFAIINDSSIAIFTIEFLIGNNVINWQIILKYSNGAMNQRGPLIAANDVIAFHSEMSFIQSTGENSENLVQCHCENKATIPQQNNPATSTCT